MALRGRVTTVSQKGISEKGLSKTNSRQRTPVGIPGTSRYPAGTSNVRQLSKLKPMKTRRELIQEEVQRLLEEEDNWHLDDSTPSNMINVSDPKHAKAVIQETDEESIVVLSFYAPHCRACRAMWTAKKKIAKTNPDVVFVEVNTNVSSLATMAEDLGVSRQPWFIILSGGTAEEVSSFTANLQTIDRLRAEIAATKECTGECLEANT